MRDLDSVIEAARPELEALEKPRRDLIARRRKAGRHIAITAAVVLGVGSLVAFVTKALPLLIIAAVGALIVAGIMLYVQIIAPTERFKAKFKTAAIGAVVRAMEPGMTFAPQRGVPESRFVESRLFKSPDRYSCEDGLSGTIGDTAVLISEVHAEQRHTSRDSKGRQRARYTTIFDGIFLVADFHKHFRGTTRVLPDTAERLFGGLGKMLQNLRPFSDEELVYLEDPEFEGEFVVYGTDQIEARYILSTAMARRILDLKRKWKNDVRLAFVNSNVFVAITHGKDLFEPNVNRSALSREQLGRIVSELAVCFDLVEDLNLNTRIWSKV